MGLPRAADGWQVAALGSGSDLEAAEPVLSVQRWLPSCPTDGQFDVLAGVLMESRHLRVPGTGFWEK